VEPLVFGQIDDAHAPFADLLEDTVVRDQCAQQGIHGVWRRSIPERVGDELRRGSADDLSEAPLNVLQLCDVQ
jgi:hypothetical protein